MQETFLPDSYNMKLEYLSILSDMFEAPSLLIVLVVVHDANRRNAVSIGIIQCLMGAMLPCNSNIKAPICWVTDLHYLDCLRGNTGSAKLCSVSQHAAAAVLTYIMLLSIATSAERSRH